MLERQQLVALLLGAPSCADVLDGTHVVDLGTGRRRERRRRDDDGDVVSVGVAEDEVELAGAAGHEPPVRVLDVRELARVGGIPRVGRLRPEQVVDLAADDVRESLVGLGDEAGAVDDEEPVLQGREVCRQTVVELALLGDVRARPDVADEGPSLVEARLAAIGDPAVLAVRREQSVRRLVPARRPLGRDERVETRGPVVGMQALDPAVADLGFR